MIPFSLFAAYQFLSCDGRFDTPESKMRPSPSCVCRRFSALMMEMIATGFFFVYCVSNFEFRFYFKTDLTTVWRRVTIQHLRRKEWSVLLCSDHIVWPCDLICVWPHSYRRFLPSRPHVVFGVFLSYFLCSFSLPAELFSSEFHTSKWWPHIIFSDTDLTTFLTIVTSVVHGDKMSGEYEKAVFA